MNPSDGVGRRRPTFVLLALIACYAAIVCVAATGLGPGWRNPIEMARAIDPNGLARAWYDAAADPFAALLAVAVRIAVYAPIGGLAAVALARSGRGAVLAGVLGFDISVAEQLLRWLRPNHAPSLIAPAIATFGALAGWLLVRVLTRRPPPERRGFGWFAVAIGGSHLLAGTVVGAVLVLYGLATLGMTPSQLGSFLALHGAGRHPAIQPVASMLERLDRMNLGDGVARPAWAGADVSRDVPRPPGRLRDVDSIASLRQSIGDARPGDVIELLPGHYRLDATIQIGQPGSAENPVVVRAASLGSVVIDATTVEAFKLHAPHWVFENLVMRGTCPDDAACDHAFHIVGGASDAEFRNLRLEDFNAHFKINGEDGGFPDRGRIEYVTLLDTRPRRTGVPVTPIDLDAASDWVIADSFVADFAKDGGDGVSYGGYAKAAGSGNVFERNVVVCEWRVRALAGQRIGLSFGGGGSDPGIRRDLGRSGYEQSGSVMRDNLIAACSDDGIYINRSPDTLVLHNTLIDTAGIDVRFAESMATVRANLVDGPIRGRDDGLLWEDGNLSTGIWQLFRGAHPVRSLFIDPVLLDLRWRGPPPAGVPGGGEADLCRRPRQEGALSPPGAFGDFSACLTPK